MSSRPLGPFGDPGAVIKVLYGSEAERLVTSSSSPLLGFVVFVRDDGAQFKADGVGGWFQTHDVGGIAFTDSRMFRWDTGTLSWVKVSGGTTTGPDVNVTNFPANYALTNAELRATPVPTFQNNALITVAHDAWIQTQNATQDIWTCRTGGLGGTIVGVVTITYTDSTKLVISTVVKT